jgi:hypothetical protein
MTVMVITITNNHFSALFMGKVLLGRAKSDDFSQVAQS